MSFSYTLGKCCRATFHSVGQGLTLIAALLSAPTQVNSCVMRDDVPSSDYEQYSVQFNGQAMWIKYTKPDGVQSYCSAYRLNDRWAITAAHCVEQSGIPVTNISAGTSNNYNTPELGEVRNVVRVIMHPGYIGGPTTAGYTSVDVALLQFDAPLVGPSVSIGSVAVGATIKAVGYGRPGTPTAGFLPTDGKRRAYQMSYFFQSSRPLYYRFTFWDGDNGFLPFEGAAMPGDSGSGIVNSAGELVGIMNTGSPTYPRNPTENNALRLHLYKDWIETNIVSPLDVTALFGVVHVNWDSTAKGWRLQSSTNLSTWTDIGGTIAAAGSIDESTEGTPQKFYRLAKP